jgi:hypothetical protein
MAATAVFAVGAVVAAYGSVVSGQAQAASANRQAAAAQTNVDIDHQNAVAAENSAAANEAINANKDNYRLSQLRGSLIQANIGTDGTAADVVGQQAKNDQLDNLNIRYAGALKANAYNNQGLMDTAAVTNDEANASDATTAGYIGAAGSLLGGAAKIYQYKKGA